jgi:hypothetical protein
MPKGNNQVTLTVNGWLAKALQVASPVGDTGGGGKGARVAGNGGGDKPRIGTAVKLCPYIGIKPVVINLVIGNRPRATALGGGGAGCGDSGGDGQQ